MIDLFILNNDTVFTQKNQFQNDCYICFLFNALFNSVCNQDPGELRGILGGGVPPGSPNPDPISDQKCHFPHPLSGLKEVTKHIIHVFKCLLIITAVQASEVIIDRLLRQCCFVWSEIVGPHSSGNFNDSYVIRLER